MKRARELVTDMPAGIPYFTYLGAVATDSHPPTLDWETAYENWAVSRDPSIDQPQLIESMATDLKTFDERTEQSTANTLYRALAAHKLEFGVLLDSSNPSISDELGLTAKTTQLLIDIATETPHRVVFVNAVCWLLAIGHDSDQAILQTASFDEALADPIWSIFRPTSAKPAVVVDPIIASLAKAGCYDAQLWLCEQLSYDSSYDVKSTALRFGYSNVTPESADLYGEPNNRFAPALVDFIQRTELHSELRAEKIDDALCHAVIEILSEGLCTCIVDGTELSFFKQNIAIEEILRLTIEHLQGRSLRLDDLFDLAWFYHVVFEEIDRWLCEDVDSRFDENDLVFSRDKHRHLAQSIRDVFATAGNDETIRIALEAGGIKSENAQIALDRINGTYSPNTYYLSR